MSSNSFGKLFRITTWGESHGKALGVVIDGCPAGLEISETEINHALALRAPGRNNFTSPRKETDRADIYSGVFEGKTTGAPISIIIHNHDVDSTKYDSIKNVLRPGHANFTYLNKYGIADHRGGGRASARETVCRVAAGAVAKKLLQYFSIETLAYLKSVSDAELADIQLSGAQDFLTLKKNLELSELFCPHVETEIQIKEKIQQAMNNGDSLGGIIEFMAIGLPVGLGDPVYEKLEANLANAMLSLPATKGFEIGEGFRASHMQGSAHNDIFTAEDSKVKTITNHAGGTLGGVSTGMPLIGRVAFKPTSSIKRTQQSIDLEGNAKVFELPEGSRHDPCVAIRAVPIVDAMCALVLADALLMNRSAKL